MKNGYNPYIEAKEIASEVSLNTLSASVKKVSNERTEFLRRKSRLTYLSKVDCFLQWIEKKQISDILIGDFTQERAEDFLRFLKKEKEVGDTTRNAYMLLMRSLWKTMQKQRIIDDNVWEQIERLREERVGMLPFKPNQKQRLKNYFIEHDPELWLFVQFEYYCFIRPGELRNLTVGAIDLDEGTIFVEAKINKNKKSEYVIIPPPLLRHLQEINITHYNPKYYVFSKGGTPGEEQYGYNTMYERHKKALRNLGYNARYSLYSWKHTGACDAIRAGVKIKELQIQLRHADLQTTDIYLRSIGIKDLDDLRDKFPTL